MTQQIREIKAKQGRNGIQVALIVATSMVSLGFIGWIAMFTTGS